MNQRFEAGCYKICAHLLKDDQKPNQLALCKGLQEQAKKERDFHSKFRAGDENWVYGYGPGKKQQSSSCHPRELRQMKSDFKSMLSMFLNSEAVLQMEFFVHCLPVNQHFCIGVPSVLVEAVGRKCLTSSLHGTGWLLYHDNTSCHMDSRLFPVPNQNQMVVISGLCTSPS